MKKWQHPHCCVWQAYSKSLLHVRTSLAVTWKVFYMTESRQICFFSWCSEYATPANSWECRESLQEEMCVSHTTPSKVLLPDAVIAWAGCALQAWLSLMCTVLMGPMERPVNWWHDSDSIRRKANVKMSKCTFWFWPLQSFQWGRKAGGIQRGSKLLVGYQVFWWTWVNSKQDDTYSRSWSNSSLQGRLNAEENLKFRARGVLGREKPQLENNDAKLAYSSSEEKNFSTPTLQPLFSFWVRKLEDWLERMEQMLVKRIGPQLVQDSTSEPLHPKER